MSERDITNQLASDEWDRVCEMVNKSIMCEFSVVKNGRPLTYPLTPFYDAVDDVIFVTSSPGLSKKFDSVEETPEATMLLFTHGTPLLLKGRIRMKDVDPWEGGQYIIDVINQSSDPERKGKSFTELPNSRVAAFVMDWYILRRIAIFEPEESIELPEVEMPAVPPCEAIDMDEAEAARHERVVISSVDDAGYPLCYPVDSLEESDGEFTLTTAGGEHPDGPACLLLHWYADTLEQLGQQVIRGTLRRDNSAYTYKPAGSFDTELASGLGRLKFAFWGKKCTREYFGESRFWKWSWDVSALQS